jgi:S-DNA-T family DNA segregation ATPase FtsK/SpoIIIE
VDLHVTLVAAPPHDFETEEIVVDTARLPTGSALAGRLLEAGYPGPLSVDGRPLDSLNLAPPEEVPPGSVIVAGQPPDRSTAALPPLAFVVHSGPDAGQVFPLVRGSYTIGRARAAITLSDPGLSRNHALLTIGQHSIVIEDLGSANGTLVDGSAVTKAVIDVSSELRFGSSRCSIDIVDGQGWTPSVNPSVLGPLPVGHRVPKRPSKVLVLTALLPLVLGVVLALTTGMWFFLAFSALSAVTGLVPLAAYRRSAAHFASALQDAADRDRRRRVVAVPDPGRSALDALRPARSAMSTSPTKPRTSAVVLLRLGTAHQRAHVSSDASDALLVLPMLHDVPFLLPCGREDGGTTSFTVTGDAEAVRGLRRALLLQTAHPRAGQPVTVIWAAPLELARHARFLPHVVLTRDPVVLADLTRKPGLLIVLHEAEDVPVTSGAATVVILRFLADPRSSRPGAVADVAAGDRCVLLSADDGIVQLEGEQVKIIPDGVSENSFERAARALARSVTADRRAGGGDQAEPGAQLGAPPASASLWSDVLNPLSVRKNVADQWRVSDPERPTARLGRSSSGPLLLDLVRDGPHLLVAGTTGSGKSELLRTLVLGLALHQPPEHLSLLLIDYKGGSGLGALAALPHCVGSMTDLSSESTARALTSMRAELRRREALCADQGVHDLDALRRASPVTCPPRLVVVIDEFRMLSDDVPTAVADLMKIAALGRSLGVHLVLATQRVQGAITPDLRTNITSSILLRVQTAMESQDLLGSGAAAEISVDLPGRAFLRRGAEEPLSFQVASSSTLPRSADPPGWQFLTDFLGERDVRQPDRRRNHAAPGPRGRTSDRSDPSHVPFTLTGHDIGRAPGHAHGDARGRATNQGLAHGENHGTDYGTDHGRDHGPDPRPETAQEDGPASSVAKPSLASASVLTDAVRAVVDAAGGPGRRRPPGPVLPPLPAFLTPDLCRTYPPADDRNGTAYASEPGQDQRKNQCKGECKDHGKAHDAAMHFRGARGGQVALGLIDLPERQEQRALLWRPENHSHLALIGLPASGLEDAVAAVVVGLPQVDHEVHLYLLDGDGSLAGHTDSDHTGAYVGAAEPARAARVLERLAALTADAPRPRSPIVLAVTGWGRWSTQFRQGRLEDDLQALVRDGAACGVSVLISGDRELTTARFFALVPNRVYLPLGAHQETTMTWPRIPPIDAHRGRGLVQGRIAGTTGDAVCQLVLAAEIPQERPPAPTRAPFPVHALPKAVTLEELHEATLAIEATDPTGTALALGLHGDDLRPYLLQMRSAEVVLVLGHAASGRSNALRVLEASSRLLQAQLEVLTPRQGGTAGGAAAYWRSVAGTSGSSCEGFLLLVDDADQLPADVQQALSSLVTRGAAAVLTAAPSPSLMARVPLSLPARASGRGIVLSPRNSSDGDFFGVRIESSGLSVPGRALACGPSGVQELQIAHAPGPSGPDPRIAVTGGGPVPTAFVRGSSFGR